MRCLCKRIRRGYDDDAGCEGNFFLLFVLMPQASRCNGASCNSCPRAVSFPGRSRCETLSAQDGAMLSLAEPLAESLLFGFFGADPSATVLGGFLQRVHPTGPS